MATVQESINRIICEFPCNLLLQYSYYLNPEATQEITIGYDPYTFDPCVFLLWLQESTVKFLHLNRDDWTFVRNCMYEILDIFVGDLFCDENYKTISPDQLWEMKFCKQHGTNGESGFELKSTKFSLSIFINYTEMKMLTHLGMYCTSILAYYADVKTIMQSYYDEYLTSCYVNGKNRLSYGEFILGNESVRFNWLRVFTEIPIICKNKLAKDLSDLRA